MWRKQLKKDRQSSKTIFFTVCSRCFPLYAFHFCDLLSEKAFFNTKLLCHPNNHLQISISFKSNNNVSGDTDVQWYTMWWNEVHGHFCELVYTLSVPISTMCVHYYTHNIFWHCTSKYDMCLSQRCVKNEGNGVKVFTPHKLIMKFTTLGFCCKAVVGN